MIYLVSRKALIPNVVNCYCGSKLFFVLFEIDFSKEQQYSKQIYYFCLKDYMEYKKQTKE